MIGFRPNILTPGALPDFLIIGAQKAGTTSLASYLAAHPCVVAPRWKEAHFFDLNYEKGIDWYRSIFPVGVRARVGSRFRGRRLQTGDSTPYYILHPWAAARARDLLPKAKIVILLRDPVDRAHSHYHHEVRLGKETLTFEEAIDAEDSRIAGEARRLAVDPYYTSFNYQHFSYLERGIYSHQMMRWLKFYPPSQILVLSSELFFASPDVEYRRVLKFLGLPEWKLPAYPAEHVGTYAPMSKATRKRLREFYAPHNQTLRQQLNSDWPGTGDAIVDRFSA
jgi:hypothetical protein